MRRQRVFIAAETENLQDMIYQITGHLRVSFTVAAMYLCTCKLARFPSKKWDYIICHAYLQSHLYTPAAMGYHTCSTGLLRLYSDLLGN